MNVEIGIQAVKFPEKKYINGIFLALHYVLIPRWRLISILVPNLFKVDLLSKEQRNRFIGIDSWTCTLEAYKFGLYTLNLAPLPFSLAKTAGYQRWYFRKL